MRKIILLFCALISFAQLTNAQRSSNEEIVRSSKGVYISALYIEHETRIDTVISFVATDHEYQVLTEMTTLFYGKCQEFMDFLRLVEDFYNREKGNVKTSISNYIMNRKVSVYNYGIATPLAISEENGNGYHVFTAKHFSKIMTLFEQWCKSKNIILDNKDIKDLRANNIGFKNIANDLNKKDDDKTTNTNKKLPSDIYRLDTIKEHIKFKGIDIDGNIDDFIKKMEDNGFTFEKLLTDNVVKMKGKFMGKSCDLLIIHSIESKEVWKVTVYFKEKESWYDLKKEYLDTKNLFVEKYGVPKSHYEFFSEPYYEGDGYELQAIEKDKCTYRTFFYIGVGYIAIGIGPGCCLRISYEDFINSNKDEIERKSNALEEI